MGQYYDNPDTCTYNFALMDFGAAAGATTHRIGGPAGKKGKVREIGVAVAEAFVTVTTLAHVQVGTAADLDAYGKLNIPTGSAINTVVNSTDDTDAIIKESNSIDTVTIPAETCVVITLTEGTGGGLTGQGNPYVIIDWF